MYAELHLKCITKVRPPVRSGVVWVLLQKNRCHYKIHFAFTGEKRGQGKQSWTGPEDIEVTRPEETEGVGGTEDGWSYKLRDSQDLNLNMLGTHSVIP